MGFFLDTAKGLEETAGIAGRIALKALT